MKKRFSKDEYGSFLNNLSSDYKLCSNCIFKEYLIRCQPSIEMLVQSKCIEFFLKELKREKEMEISWQKALEGWIEKGYAKVFRDKLKKLHEDQVYKVLDLDIRSFYEEIKKEVKNEN